ncbi:MAG: hypothetical protein QG599_506 [Pseudomonadota bacterium]|nr:hypothetical protein [Pseudomonadota bacterium]
MKKIIFAASLFFGVIGATPVIAADTPSCTDMKEFSTALRGAADYISSTKGDFSDNEKMEKDMSDLVSILQEFAKQAGDADFSDAVKDMAAIWEKETWKGDDVKEFKRSFDATAVALDRVAEKHCAAK